MAEKIVHRQNKFLMRLEPGKYAYLEYRVEDGIFFIDSTYTPPDHRGRGIAAKLVEEAIFYSKENGLRIVPNCDYAKKYFEEHPEYRQLLR